MAVDQGSVEGIERKELQNRPVTFKLFAACCRREGVPAQGTRNPGKADLPGFRSLHFGAGPSQRAKERQNFSGNWAMMPLLNMSDIRSMASWTLS